jgi:peptide/nickel transport system permease protein
MQVLPGDIAMVILSEETGTVDPVKHQILSEKLGLNLPVYQQYFNWLWGLVNFDLGKSLWSGQTVVSEIGVRLPYTVSLVFISLFISIITAIPIGVLSALKQDKWPDYILRSVVVAGISLPNFWLAILIILFLIRAFKWFPPLEYATLWANPAVAIQQLALPAAIMGFRAAAGSARMMRSSMLEVLREDYVRTARSKGLVERVVVYGHALRNAVLPVVTVFGMELAFLFGGSVIMETIFNIPGIGSLLINAIHRRDIILVQGIVVTLITVLLLVNLLVDVLYGVIDPRIRFGKRR